MAFDRIAILGTGLIGASIGLAAKAARPSTHVLGYDAKGGHAREAQRLKAVDRAVSLRDAVERAELVVIATPVGAMRALFEEIGPLLQPGSVVLDTGSTKAQVLAWAEAALPAGTSFVGSHPMAGKTESGPEVAEAGLFQGAVWCVVPAPSASRQAIERVLALVESLGAVPYFTDAEEHDGLVAAVSHLPYLLSVALINHLGAEHSWRETATVAAGGFAYGTHLTESDPQMFADIVRTNRDSVVRRLDRYIAELESLRDDIQADAPDLKTRFERARQLHREWLSGRAQGLAGDGSELPSNRSMLMGGLLGRLGSGDRDERGPEKRR